MDSSGSITSTKICDLVKRGHIIKDKMRFWEVVTNLFEKGIEFGAFVLNIINIIRF